METVHYTKLALNEIILKEWLCKSSTSIINNNKPHEWNNLYLENGMAGAEAAVGGHHHALHQQVRAAQVRHGLVHRRVRVIEPGQVGDPKFRLPSLL